MCVLNGSQVHWTSDVDEAIRERGAVGVKDYHAFLEKQLTESVVLVRQKLSKQEKITLNALIVIDVHAKDVVGKLVEKNHRKRPAPVAAAHKDRQLGTSCCAAGAPRSASDARDGSHARRGGRARCAARRCTQGRDESPSDTHVHASRLASRAAEAEAAGAREN